MRLEAGSTVIVHQVEHKRYRRCAIGRPRLRGVKVLVTLCRLIKPSTECSAKTMALEFLQAPTGAEIIRFPGAREVERYGTVTQQCFVDGEVVRIGGTRERVPITLRSEEELITDCYTSRTTAKRLAAHLFEPVRLFGNGRFAREDDGSWKLEYFVFENFTRLTDEPLSSVVEALRAIPGGEWGEDALDELRFIRLGSIGRA